MITEPDRLQVFAADFLNFYLERGLGSLTKKDIDLHIFHLISRIEQLDAKSNHQMALDFKITPTKIKTLRFERNLKYQQEIQIDINNEFFKCLSKVKLKKIGSNNWIAFNIENTFVREGIKAKLKRLNHFSDSSFNAEIISLDIEAFSDLISEMYNNSKFDENLFNKLNVKAMGTVMEKDKEGNITLKNLFKAFIEGVVTESGVNTFSSGLSFLTGGTNDILSLILRVNNLFPS